MPTDLKEAIKPDTQEEDTPARATSFFQRGGISEVVLAVLILIGVLRIVSTYHVFNHTIDEGAHLACGIQWFNHAYTYDQKHTPIARISLALLPYLNGLRAYGDPSYWQEGSRLLSTNGQYWRNLTLARLGVLPYFILSTVVVFLWSRRIYGNTAALVAAGVFSMLPVVLAHSALATTDIPLTAFFLLAVYAFTCWLSVPNWRTSTAFGIATGLAISTKLSTLAFLPASMVGVLLVYYASARPSSAERNQEPNLWNVRKIMSSAALAAVCVFFVVWAAYRFSHAPIKQFSATPDKMATRVFGASSAMTRGIHALTAKVQLPAPELYAGLRGARNISNFNPRSYMFGRVKKGGWWYFYPVAILVKTPIAALLLALLGALFLTVDWLRKRENWRPLVPLVASILILVIAAPTKFDIGVRHVMPVFAFLSMLAGLGAVRLWNWRAASTDGSRAHPQLTLWAGPAATLVLLTWLLVSSGRAHPDYLAYFNEFGGKHPENILVISDFDWGQDLARLASYLREHDVKHVSIAYAGVYDPAALGLPETQEVGCGAAPAGWVAMEERRARLSPECFPWLRDYTPITVVGKTMRLYHIPGSPGQNPPPASQSIQDPTE